MDVAEATGSQAAPPRANIASCCSLQRDIDKGFSTTGQPVHALVTGSLHLIGGVIEVADLSEVAL